MKFSIIIPTYNEAENIGALVKFLMQHSSDNTEVVVCDAGSNDDTMRVARDAGAIAVLSPEKGRAKQMNYGAAVATGDILYFVHADTHPPKSFISDISQALEAGYSIGRYRTTFDSNKLLLKMNAWFTRFDLFVCYGGDQTLFITRTLFNSLNGFDDSLRIMEDYDIVVRAKKTARYAILKGAAKISARKYETNSWLQVQKANYTIVQMYKQGASQQSMIDKYKQLLHYR